MLKKRVSRRTFLTVSAMSAAALALDWKRVSRLAARMGPKDRYPTVVVGAGLGGLCCAAYLGKQGIPVTVIERHEIPGGYATAFERKGGEYRFEVSLHGTSCYNNAPARILKNLGVLDRVEWIELPEVYRLKLPTMEISVPQRDPDAYVRILAKQFPEDAEGVRSFVQEIIGISEEVDTFHRRGEANSRILKLFFPLRYRKMWSVRNKTLDDLLKAHVKLGSARDVLAALWGYYGLPPSRLSGFYYANATGGYLKNGSFSIKRRSQDLSYVLAEVIEKSGGRILYQTSAEKILVEKGSVTGVRVSGRGVLPARAVVSNASALSTFRDLVPPDSVPVEYLNRIKACRPSISSFIVWLGLNRELRGKIKGFSTHVASGRGAEADYQSCIKGDIDRGPYSVSIYDNLYPGYSKPGTSSLMLLFLCGYAPWRTYASDYRLGNKGAYYQEKNRWTDILIRRAEADVIPGLSSMIAVKEAATPLTNWRYTGNPQGAIYGFEQSMDNAYMNRLHNRTPIKGLYLASAWGSPGGGYAGVLRAGEQTFQLMMEDWGG